MEAQAEDPEATPVLKRLAGIVGGVAAVLLALAGLAKAVGALTPLFPQNESTKEIAAFKNKQVLEHGTYTVKDNATSLTLKINEVSAKRNLVEASLSTDPNTAQFIEIPNGQEHYFVAGENQYVITVNDLADVAFGTDFAEITIRKK